MKTETLEATTLATVGAVEAIWRYYRPELAWAALGLGVLAYDVLCEPGSTLSETFRKQPLPLQIGEIALVASHLTGILPKKVDPFTRLMGAIK